MLGGRTALVGQQKSLSGVGRREGPVRPDPTGPNRCFALALASLLRVCAVNQTNAEAVWDASFSVPVDLANAPAGMVAEGDLPASSCVYWQRRKSSVDCIRLLLALLLRSTPVSPRRAMMSCQL